MRKFREAVQSDNFAISAELTLKRETTSSDINQQIDVLGEIVDGIQITDSPWSWVQMSPIAASALLLKRGVDPIPILTCRDRNRIALQSDLIGMRAIGVTSLLLTRGRRVPKEHHIPATTVFDTTGRELIGMANALNEEPSTAPNEQFFIGAGAKLFLPQKNWRAESLQARAKAGARFLQTQLCFKPDVIRAYIEALVKTKLTWRYSVMISLTTLPSVKTALWLKNNMPDSRIPDHVIKRLEDAVDEEQEGIKICAELMQDISDIPGVSGVNLMTMGNPESIPAAINQSGLRSS